jgi:hypothetical protein
MMGPAMGPTAAMAAKCWPSRMAGRVGTKSTPSSSRQAGVGRRSSSPKTRPR